MSLQSSPLPWGTGDLWTLLIALWFFALGCHLNRHALRRLGHESVELLGTLMGSGLAVGPMVMILTDPLNKAIGVIPVDMMAIVMREARVTLWFSCFMALLNVITTLLKPRE
jgi:hypothetical protein